MFKCTVQSTLSIELSKSTDRQLQNKKKPFSSLFISYKTEDLNNLMINFIAVFLCFKINNNAFVKEAIYLI
jgi:hypothetical protein